MNKKKAKSNSTADIPPIIPPEIEKNLEKEMKATFGFETGGDYTVSIEFGIETSGTFDHAVNLTRDHDHRQKITRRGRECYYVTYNLRQLKEMMDLYYAVQNLEYKELYINHRKLPYAHSLWVQLFQLMA